MSATAHARHPRPPSSMCQGISCGAVTVVRVRNIVMSVRAAKSRRQGVMLQSPGPSLLLDGGRPWGRGRLEPWHACKRGASDTGGWKRGAPVPPLLHEQVPACQLYPQPPQPAARPPARTGLTWHAKGHHALHTRHHHHALHHIHPRHRHACAVKSRATGQGRPGQAEEVRGQQGREPGRLTAGPPVQKREPAQLAGAANRHSKLCRQRGRLLQVCLR